MSDNWQTYGCQIDDSPAFVTYDHGLATELDGLKLENLIVISIPIANSNSHGMPSGDEHNQLNAIEDLLLDLFPAGKAVMAGRVTNSAIRSIFYYTVLNQQACGEIAQQVEHHSGRRLLLRHTHDPSHAGYWKELFPTDDELQVIKDIRLHETLMERGDPLTEPREIQHWAYFKTDEARRQFLDQVAANLGTLSLQEAYETDDGQFGARLAHVGLPDWQSISAITVKLNNFATQAGGEYDGWETEVCAIANKKSPGVATPGPLPS
jgi:uncharacterized protein (TIGR01619 family)